MAKSVAHIQVQVEGAEDGDSQETAELTLQLREELLELDIESADLAADGEAPAGTRGIELAALGAIVVKVAASVPMLTGVVTAVQSWLSRSGSRNVRLEIDGDVLEVTGVSSREQRELIDAWLQRRGTG